MLYRLLLSQKNGWADGENRVFVIYPIKELARDMGKSERSVNRALNELSANGYVDNNRRGPKPNCVFLTFPEKDMTFLSEDTTVLSGLSMTEAAKDTTVLSGLDTTEIAKDTTALAKDATALSYHPIEENTEDNTKRKYLEENTKEKDHIDDSPHIYGLYHNVLLRGSEARYLQERFPEYWSAFINALSYDIYLKKSPRENCFAELLEKLKKSA